MRESQISLRSQTVSGALHVALLISFKLLLPFPSSPQKPKDLWNELGKSIIGRSEYSFYGLFFFALRATGGFVRPSKKDEYKKNGADLRRRILEKLGTNGVLFYPTFPQPAMRHCESPSKMSGVMYSMIFNLLGFPSTHVPVIFIYFYAHFALKFHHFSP